MFIWMPGSCTSTSSAPDEAHYTKPEGRRASRTISRASPAVRAPIALTSGGACPVGLPTCGGRSQQEQHGERPTRCSTPRIAYIDTSALPRIVLREPGALEDVRAYEALVSSELIAVESARTVDRLWTQRSLTLRRRLNAYAGSMNGSRRLTACCCVRQC
jgi:hypothetical protein